MKSGKYKKQKTKHAFYCNLSLSGYVIQGHLKHISGHSVKVLVPSDPPPHPPPLPIINCPMMSTHSI